MKVSGPLTHARFAAEAARLVRKASRWVAHETLRMHSGDHQPGDPVSEDDVKAFRAEINEIMRNIA